ncbi:MAG: hypothetical protein WD178_07860 [Actinomycetota bacterium]
MRKWICVGVLGGLLEFGIIYQVAFSGTDSPSPETLTENDAASKNALQAKKAGRSRTPRHIAAAAGVDDTDGTTTPQPAKPVGKKTASPPAASAPTDGTSEAGAGPTASPGTGDPLDDTLRTAVAAIVALPVSLGLSDALIPEPPLEVPDPLEPAPAEAEQAVSASASPVPAAPAEAVNVAELPIEEMIRHVFGPEGDKAVEVARCESTLRTHAKKGQFLGLFQMGANERADYGHGPDALAQVLAAHALFLDRGWQPWACA